MTHNPVFHDPDEADGREWFAFQIAINWCQGTIIQGNRVLNLRFPEMLLSVSLESSKEHRKKFDEYQIYRLIDEHFFLIAARQVIRWCEFAKKQYSELTPAIDKFCSDRNIIDTRNMREHNDEYLVGKGNKQKNYVSEVKSINFDIPGDQLGTCDASSTIVDGDRYLIGGRVDVLQTLKKIEELLNVMIPFMHNKWPWTAPR